MASLAKNGKKLMSAELSKANEEWSKRAEANRAAEEKRFQVDIFYFFQLVIWTYRKFRSYNLMHYRNFMHIFIGSGGYQ